MSDLQPITTGCGPVVTIGPELVADVALLTSEMTVLSLIDADNIGTAAALLKRSSQLRAANERHRKALQAPFTKAGKAIKAAVDSLSMPLITADAALKQLIAAYEWERRKQEQARDAAEAAAEAAAAEDAVALEAEMNDLFGGEMELEPPKDVEIAAPRVERKQAGVATIETIVWDEATADTDSMLSCWKKIHAPMVNAHLRENKAALIEKIAATEDGKLLYHGIELSIKLTVRAS